MPARRQRNKPGFDEPASRNWSATPTVCFSYFLPLVLIFFLFFFFLLFFLFLFLFFFFPFRRRLVVRWLTVAGEQVLGDIARRHLQHGRRRRHAPARARAAAALRPKQRVVFHSFFFLLSLSRSGPCNGVVALILLLVGSCALGALSLSLLVPVFFCLLCSALFFPFVVICAAACSDAQNCAR